MACNHLELTLDVGSPLILTSLTPVGIGVMSNTSHNMSRLVVKRQTRACSLHFLSSVVEQAEAQQGSMTGRSRALLASLGSAISRPFSGLGVVNAAGAGLPPAGTTGYSARPFSGLGGTGASGPPPAGTTGYSGGPPPPPPPAKGWELLHAQDGRPYYHHHASGTTTWERPASDHHGAQGEGQSQWWPAASDSAASSYLPTKLNGAAARPLPPNYPPPTPPPGASASARGHASNGAVSRTPGEPRPARVSGRPAAPDDNNTELAWALEQSLSKGGGGGAAAGSGYKPRDPFPQPAVRRNHNSLGAPRPPVRPTGSGEDPELAWALAESLKASGNAGGSAGGGSDQPVPRGAAFKATHAAVDAAAAPLIVFGPD